MKAKGHGDHVTVIGSLPSVSAGEWVTAEGRWVQDREFGLQFRAEMLNSTAPTTKEGIEKYLGSGMVKGIGPIYAKKLVATFGEKIFDVIETQSARLEDVDGCWRACWPKCRCPEWRSSRASAAIETATAKCSVFGPLTLRRDYYHPPGPEGGFPLDRVLGVIGGCTPGAARMLGRTAAQLPFVQSSQQGAGTGGLDRGSLADSAFGAIFWPPGASALGRIAGAGPKPVPQFYVSVDGTGVPMVHPELEGRAGKGPQGQAKTREVKLAAFFTQTTTDAQGHPLRDPQSTTYLGSFVCSDQFGPQTLSAARQRGLAQASQIIYLGDGAAWVWEIARTCFARAAQILDYYHASEHVATLAKAIYADPGTAQNWTIRWQSLLYDSELDELFAEVRTACPTMTCNGNSIIWSAIERVWITELAGSEAGSSAQEWWRRAANASLANDSSNQACFGPNPAPPQY